jgi:hypothetical protein
MRTTRLMLAASGVATAALLASSGLANAAVVNGPNITGPGTLNTSVAGYEVASTVPFNEVRAIVNVPAGSSSDVDLALQQTVNGGYTTAIRLHLENFGALDGWVLQVANDPFFGGNAEVGTFNPAQIPNSGPFGWQDVGSIGGGAGDPLFFDNTGGTYYLEIHESTGTHTIAYVAGPAETNAATLAKTFNFNGRLAFSAPAVEASICAGPNLNRDIREVCDGGAPTLGLNSPQVSFSRVGVTEPAGSNVGGTAGTRVTLDFFNTVQTLAALFGPNPPGVANPLTLVTGPSLPGKGSAFGVMGGSL